MRSLTHREFRNDSAKVLEAVEHGESFLITNNGRLVGKLVPADSPAPELRMSRPASTRGGFTLPAPSGAAETTAETLDQLRGER
jgi:prevent-host-death family protein